MFLLMLKLVLVLVLVIVLLLPLTHPRARAGASAACHQLLPSRQARGPATGLCPHHCGLPLHYLLAYLTLRRCRI